MGEVTVFTSLTLDGVMQAGRPKARPNGDLVVLGSGEFVKTLMKHDLVDTYMLLIHPLFLGTGRRRRRPPAS